MSPPPVTYLCRAQVARLAGRSEGSELLDAGKAGTGFTGDTARALRERKIAAHQACKKPKATWVKPVELVDVEFRAVTDDGDHP